LKFRLGKDIADLAVDHLAGQLQAGLIRGFTAGLTVNGAELRRKSYSAKLDEIHAEGGMDSGGLYLASGSVKGDRITASANATRVPHHDAVEATFDPGILGVVVDELSALSGEAHVVGTLNGDLLDPTDDGQLTVTRGAIAHHLLGNLSTHVTHRGARLGFDQVRLEGARGGLVTGDVDLVVVKEVPLNGELTWDGVDLEGMLATIGPQVPLANRFGATTSVHGSLDPLDIEIKASGGLQSAQGESRKDVGSFVGGARVHPHDLDAQLEVKQPQGNTTTARVVIDHDIFAGSVRLNAADLAALNAVLPRPMPALRLTGKADGSGEFGGTTEHPTVSGKLAVADATIAGTRVSRLAGDFSVAAGTLRTQAATLQTTGGAVDLSGTIALDATTANEWRLALRDVDTDLLLGTVNGLTNLTTPVSGGVVNGSFTCRGPWARTQTQALLTVKGPRVGAEPLDHVDIEVTTSLPQWKGKLTAVRSAAEMLTAEGSGDGKTRVDISLETTPLDLSTLRGARRRRLKGTVMARAHVTGKPLQPGGTAEVHVDNLELEGGKLGAVTLQAQGTDGNWKLTGGALDGLMTLGASVQTLGGWPYTATVGWQEADLAPILTTDQALHLMTTGSIDLSGALRAPTAPSGTVRVSQFMLRRDEWQIEAPEPMRVDFDRGRFRIGSLALAAPGSRVSVSGEGSLTGDLALDVQGDGDLVLLELIGGPLHAARGAFNVGAHIGRGQPGGWELRGQASVRNVALDLGLPVAFTDTNGTFSLAGGSLRIDQLSGRAGGGEFTVGGALDLNHGPAVTWSVREVSLAFPEWLEERITGKGRVEGTWKAITVAGDIEVLNALYDRPIELSGLLPWFKEQLAPAPQIGEPAREVRLDLHLHAPDGLFVDNNIAKAELRCDLRVSGPVRTPSLDGLVEILSGDVKFRGRVFTITGGSVEFRNSSRINPILNITAESQISTTEAEYTVSVVVSGTADSPRVQFASDDPTLTQNDVLSLVTFGQTTTQPQRDNQPVGVGNILGLMPGDYDVQGHVRTLFGVDRFEVEPAYVRDTGSIEPRLTIGKDITDRLRALASSSFGQQAQNSVQLEYQLTRRLSLLSMWESRTQQEEGAIGGDLKFRYEFRTLPFSLLKNAPCPAPGDAP